MPSVSNLDEVNDGKPEGRIAAGLEPVEKLTRQKMASERRGTATLTTDSRLCRRHYYVVTKNRGLKSPRLFMFPSFRRIFSHYSSLITHCSLSRHPELVSGSVRGEGQEKARGEMLKQVNFVQFAHARHSSSKLVSALAQSQISASVRGDVLEMARCGILKQVIRLRSSKTSYIF